MLLFYRYVNLMYFGLTNIVASLILLNVNCPLRLMVHIRPVGWRGKWIGDGDTHGWSSRLQEAGLLLDIIRFMCGEPERVMFFFKEWRFGTQ